MRPHGQLDMQNNPQTSPGHPRNTQLGTWKRSGLNYFFPGLTCFLSMHRLLRPNKCHFDQTWIWLRFKKINCKHLLIPRYFFIVSPTFLFLRMAWYMNCPLFVTTNYFQICCSFLFSGLLAPFFLTKSKTFNQNTCSQHYRANFATRFAANFAETPSFRLHVTKFRVKKRLKGLLFVF